MVYYELVKVTINAPGLAEVILDMVVRHHSLPDSIVSDRGSVFTSKFWLSLCYFLGIKLRLSIAFHPQTDGQTKRQNSMMEIYLQAFINSEQNNWARLLPMTEFPYNNAKNASIGHTPFELNCDFHSRVSYKEDVDPRFQSKSADKLATELRELIAVYRENLQHAQKLQKRYHNKYVKLRSYVLSEKVLLNSKYIKTKQNRKLEAKFFWLFRVLHPVEKQVYKLELPKKWKIHDVFHISLLEQDTTRKGRVDKTTSRLEFENKGDGKGYEVEAIFDSAVYAKKLDSGHHLPDLYYLVSWKSYPKEENTWEPALAVLYFRKFISIFYRGHPEKPIATSPLIDFAPPMARPTVRLEALITKRKQGRPAKANGTNKHPKKRWTSSFLSRFWTCLNSR